MHAYMYVFTVQPHACGNACGNIPSEGFFFKKTHLHGQVQDKVTLGVTISSWLYEVILYAMDKKAQKSNFKIS